MENNSADRQINIYSLDQIKEKTGITKPTLRKYIKSEKLPARKIGGRWWVTHENLLQFFSTNN